eukprot:1149300-Pelagomonas_calceolata.AAC.2
MKETQKPDAGSEARVPVETASFSTYEAACIYNTIGKCVDMLTAEKLSTLTEAYKAAKQAGLHSTLQPPVQDTATEIPSRCGVWSPRKDAPTLSTLNLPTRPTLASTLVTRSLELAMMPSQCATLVTPSATPPRTMDRASTSAPRVSLFHSI